VFAKIATNDQEIQLAMHKVEIPKRIIDACIARRGRFHVFDEIDPKRTALIIIDMQNAWVEPGVSPLEIPESRSIVENINRLAAVARESGALVVWTQSTFEPTWTNKMYERFGTAEWRQKIIADTAIGAFGHELSSRMDVKDEDIKVVKTKPSVFIQGSSNLEPQLRERNRDTLIIAGTLTNACCESTARDAMALGFHNIIVSDGTATRSDEEHNAALTSLIQLVADVMTTDEAINLLRSR
jgi:ureidoacrylate peracid hydrolase